MDALQRECPAAATEAELLLIKLQEAVRAETAHMRKMRGTVELLRAVLAEAAEAAQDDAGAEQAAARLRIFEKLASASNASALLGCEAAEKLAEGIQLSIQEYKEKRQDNIALKKQWKEDCVNAARVLTLGTGVAAGLASWPQWHAPAAVLGAGLAHGGAFLLALPFASGAAYRGMHAHCNRRAASEREKMQGISGLLADAAGMQDRFWVTISSMLGQGLAVEELKVVAEGGAGARTLKKTIEQLEEELDRISRILGEGGGKTTSGAAARPAAGPDSLPAAGL